MARPNFSNKSPGVEIFEKDLSLQANINNGTSVLVSGFASQGPTIESLTISSISEFEAIYGKPTNAAERYFYHTCKEILNSPATLITTRLPYGSNLGDSFSSLYSGLLFPVAYARTSSSEQFYSWIIGEPIHLVFTEQQYNNIIQGNFKWGSTTVNSQKNNQNIIISVGQPQATISSYTISLSGGILIVNDLQTTINEFGEGYYIAFADNQNANNPNANFDAVTSLVTLSATNSFAPVDSTRLDFNLSASVVEYASGVNSISESLQRVGFADFGTASYMDHLSLGVFRIRQSTVKEGLLAATQVEKYVGSLNYARKELSQSGGILRNAFLEEKVNETSPTIKVLINPLISKTHNWSNNTAEPTTAVRSNTKKVFPVGIYTAQSQESDNKIIGNVPGKLEKAFRLLEIPENVTIDVICDAGLSTIYSLTEAKRIVEGSSNNGLFDETFYLPSADIILQNSKNVVENWTAVARSLVNFAENIRKDCITVLDPLRNIFVNGKDGKTILASNGTFTQSIYTPLKNLFERINSNYAVTYGNWVKTKDDYSDIAVWIPFSGFAAAVIARNDKIAYPWSSPAGMNRGKFIALDIAFNPNQKQRDRLYELGINPVVFFTGDGYVIFGQKTLQRKPSAFDRINVRRLFLALERATQKVLKYYVFEPNTEFVRTRLRNTLTPIFELAKNTEGLYDYMIICDERNNLPSVIDNNELIVDIYLKAVRTAEYIGVNFIATRTGQNFQELI